MSNLEHSADSSVLNPNYIAVEGVIGVGKSTLAGMLAKHIDAELLREEVLENPFLVDYYKNRRRYAFSCQLYFLISRFQQQPVSLSDTGRHTADPGTAAFFNHRKY